MPHMTISIDEYNRGPAVDLSITINCNIAYDSVEKEDIQIFNLALVRVEFTHDIKNDKFVVGRLRKKALPKAPKDSKLYMRVTCEDPKLLNQGLCLNEWDEWVDLGQLVIISTLENVSLFKIDIRITVSEMKTSILNVQMYEDTDFTDFHLVASNGKVAVHRAVLAVNSDVFKAMLMGKWKETTEGSIEITETTRGTLQHLKDYMYLGTIPETGLEPLLLLAKCYMINSLEKQCIEKLSDSVTCDNLYTLLEFACQNNMPELTFEILLRAPTEIVNTAYDIKSAKQISIATEEKVTTQK